SPGDATLYVAMSHHVVVIDTASLTVASVVSTDDELVGIDISPGGATVAAAGAADLHLLDTTTLTHSSMAWPGSIRPIDVAFTAANRAAAWDDARGVLVDVDLGSGVISSLATFPGG